MTINHLDQLAQWYADAEQVTKGNLPNKGDVIIFPAPSFPGYFTETVPVAWPSHLVGPREHVRILDRAPKPAWHDAPAIIATWYDRTEDEAITGVWTHDAGVWKHEDGVCVDATALTDVTPLIEAKVTREMVERAHVECMKWEFGGISENAARATLNAALGIEAE